MKTDKEVLYKGIRTLFMTIVFMFMGPSLIYIAQGNQEKPLYLPLLIAGFILCGCAIYFGFKGIRTIASSMFDTKT